jgi:hypothetical protein
MEKANHYPSITSRYPRLPKQITQASRMEKAGITRYFTFCFLCLSPEGVWHFDLLLILEIV